ncbi:hypothetical protein [Shinella zoogloeoides]
MNADARDIRQRIVTFGYERIKPLTEPALFTSISSYLLGLLVFRTPAPKRNGQPDWRAIQVACDADQPFPINLRRNIQVALLAIERWISTHPSAGTLLSRDPAPHGNGHAVKLARISPARPRFQSSYDPPSFREALQFQMDRHGENASLLHKCIALPGDRFCATTIRTWLRDNKLPRGARSMAALRRIEMRYGLAKGYLQSKLPHQSRALTGHEPGLSVGPSERRRLAWHLPDDFNRQPIEGRHEIISWVRTNIVSRTTEYRRYQAETIRESFGIRFPSLERRLTKKSSRRVDAPPVLAAEMHDLVRFKTATLTDTGKLRNKKWGTYTAAQKIEHFGLLLGALAASPSGPVAGAGVSSKYLSLALLAFPGVWDWYLSWRERRRGFFTVWECNMLSAALELVRQDTGWLRQRPDLAAHLMPIEGILEESAINAAKEDWNATCDVLHKHASIRFNEVRNVARVHRDPFEPILPILEADEPVNEYRKIADEILARAPDDRRYPMDAAEASRSYLMIRLGLHLGLRQRNLRELLLCPQDCAHTAERRLAERRCGELRWNLREGRWEVFIPAAAFKNSSSSFFGTKPFRLLLDDLAGLYQQLDAYIEHHRPRLLGLATDPGTLFVKSTKRSSTSAAYNDATFYEAWRLTIQRYGIYNPYTRRGAIEGLLPHGPHCVRDVLATHVLKKTGSYEQASYAIQDTPETVMKHYGRFFPQDKAAMAAKILNKVWES